MSFRFQFRRGTTAERDASNPVLAAGEPAVVLDSGQPAELVLGDGVTAMAGLRAAVWDDDARLALAATATQPGDLGTAAAADAEDFATAEQGAKADTAVQPAAMASAIDAERLARTRNGLVIDNAADADFLTSIVFKAGVNTQHKRYMDFRGIDDLTKWRLGVNAGNQLICYDNQAAGTHFLIAAPLSAGGAAQMNAQGSGAISFNQEANSSNGGVHVYSGGASPVRWVAIDGTGFRLFQAGVERVRVTQTGNLGLRTTDHGGGVGSIGLGNAATVPSTNPTDGGVLYAEGGALKWRGSSGTVTVIAPA